MSCWCPCCCIGSFPNLVACLTSNACHRLQKGSLFVVSVGSKKQFRVPRPFSGKPSKAGTEIRSYPRARMTRSIRVFLHSPFETSKNGSFNEHRQYIDEHLRKGNPATPDHGASKTDLEVLIHCTRGDNRAPAVAAAALAAFGRGSSLSQDHI